jgi:hypothetical protein
VANPSQADDSMITTMEDTSIRTRDAHLPPIVLRDIHIVILFTRQTNSIIRQLDA